MKRLQVRVDSLKPNVYICVHRATCLNKTARVQHTCVHSTVTCRTQQTTGCDLSPANGRGACLFQTTGCLEV